MADQNMVIDEIKSSEWKMLEEINISRLLIMAKNRRIYVWGAYDQGKAIRVYLEEHQVRVDGFIDAKKANKSYAGLPCLKPEAILDVQSVFVVIALNGLRKGILRCLENCGYREGLDYEYPFKSIPLMVLTKYTGGGIRMAEEMKYA